MKYDAVVVASGKGSRANLGFNKVFFKLKNGKTVLEEACHLFQEDEECQKVIIVTNKEDFTLIRPSSKLHVVEGGKERRDSVLNGLKLVSSDYVLIHDGARPLLNKETLEDCKKMVEEKKACIVAKASIDTIKVVSEGKIEKTLDRNMIYLAETPQAFETTLIKDAYEKGKDINYTDDALLLEELGIPVYVCKSLYNNKKLTSKDDFIGI